jgi:hypothetical protein
MAGRLGGCHRDGDSPRTWDFGNRDGGFRLSDVHRDIGQSGDHRETEQRCDEQRDDNSTITHDSPP